MIRSLPLSSVKNVGGFWRRYLDGLASKGLLSQWEQIIETERLENFLRVARGETGTFKGMRFNDSDVYKWLEGACYVQSLVPNPEVQKCIDAAVDAICNAQEADGYLFPYVQLNRPEAKWKCLSHFHEMYGMGHLIEAAIAHWGLTSNTRLLDCAKRCVDSMLTLEKSQGSVPFCGHPEIEIALYRLWEASGELKYAELADRMIDARGQRPSPFAVELAKPEIRDLIPAANHLYMKDGEYDGAYAQDDKPIREQTHVAGHSVRAAYLYSAATWSAARRGDTELQTIVQTLWDNLTQKRMYITGGIGSTGANEGFSEDYDLPNHNAYAETCAGIAAAMWAKRLFEATGSQEPLELLERSMLNGVLSGISLDTTKYFYENPLEARANTSRQLWFPCACCPPNIARFIGSVPTYCVWTDDSTIYLGIPIDMQFSVNGLDVTLTTDFPASGVVKVSISSARPTQQRLAIRIPDWSEEMEINFPDLEAPAEYENGFAVIDRTWSGTTQFEINFVMSVRTHQAHPRVLDNAGRFAVSYGPTILCVESDDFEQCPQLASFGLSDEWQKASVPSLDGTPAFSIMGFRPSVATEQELYSETESRSVQEVEHRLVPFRTWGNKGAGYMQVWLRED